MKIIRYIFLLIFLTMAVWPHQTHPLFVLRYGMIQGFAGGIMVTLDVLQFYRKKENKHDAAA